MSSPRLREGWRDALVVFLMVRLLLFGLSAIEGGMLLPPPPGQPTTDSGYPPPRLEPGWHMLVTATERQDALWYLRLATEGYREDDTSAAFFPLYPATVRAVSWLPGIGPLGAALLVSNLAFLGALLVLHALTRLELGEERARHALWALALFPTGFFLMAPYAESLFLLLSLAAFWCARRDRWGWAAAAAVGAGLTRSVGALLVLGLGLEAFRQWRKEGRAPVPRLAASAAAVLGPLLYAGYWQVRFGDAWAPLDVQRAWRPDGPTSPLRSLWDALRYAWQYQTWWLLDVVVVGFAVAGICLAARRIPAGYTAYAVASLGLPLVFPLGDRPLMSMPRFAVVLFPLAWGFALLAARRPRLGTALLGASAAGYGLLSLLYVNWLPLF
ncbi:MAG TPA: mannosyltransferase family protein [Actinomycetota bacterium]